MPKVTIVQVIYNSRKFIEPVFGAIFRQTVQDFDVVAVISGNEDGSKELLAEKFPSVKIIDPGYNIGFAAGHNLVFESSRSEFFQLVNPDLVMEPNYLEEMLKVFVDPEIGSATGKLYQFKNLQPRIEDYRKNKILDTTGVVIFKSGRARDRGQHEVDSGQYDNSINVPAVSAAGAMYRRQALVAMRLALPSKTEYFDEDFHSYWEDVDLSWRMVHGGWKNVFVPTAIAYHGRGAGSSQGGYKDVAGFIRHHKQISFRIRQFNYQNHIFMYIKNSEYFYPQFFIREFFMFVYILIFEISTFKVLPQLVRLLPKMFEKRKMIKQMASSQVSWKTP